MNRSSDSTLAHHRHVQLVTAGVALLCAMSLSYVAAFCLRFDGFPTAKYAYWMWWSMPWVVAAKMVSAAWFHIYHSRHRYVTFHDLGAIAKAITAGTVGIVLIDALLVPEFDIPRSIFLLDWGITLLLVGGLRATPRIWHNLLRTWNRTSDATRVVIVGANDSGEALLRTLRQDQRIHFEVVGFVDDHKQLTGRHIAGVPVLGALDDLPQVVDALDVDEVLIHSGELPGRTVRQLVETATAHDFRVNVLPSYEQLLAGKVSVQPRPVAIEDLLRRESVELDSQTIRDWLQGRTVMVTGSAGSIGSEICRQLVDLAPGRLVVADRSETGQFFLDRELRRLAPEAAVEVVIADLTDFERMDAVFREHTPEIIFHAAAYKHVPLMEDHPGEAIKNIALATRNVVDLAEAYDALSLVMISTDKAVNPTSVMGSCKQLAERYVQAKAGTSTCQFVTVRFGNVLDSAGSVVPVFREQIAQGGPITVTHPDIIRYFMMIPEAAQLVIQAGAMGQGGEIFVLDMGEPVKIVDLAQDMIRLSGLRVGEDIEIDFTGLRPGEKLFEELYGAAESHRTTTHPKIMVAGSQDWQLVQVMSDLSHLEQVVNEPPEVIRAELATVVPLFGETVESSRKIA